MIPHEQAWLLTASRRLYWLLLYLYPASFRAAYGRAMLQLFTDCYRDARAAHGMIGVLALWLRTLGDIGVSVVKERALALARLRQKLQPVAVARPVRVRHHADSFTEGARTALQLAIAETRRYGHARVGTEHLLIGLLGEDGGVAAHVLRDLGVKLPDARYALAFVLPRGSAVLGDEPEVSPRLVTLVDHAAAEARALNHAYVGTEHLLLGLARLSQGAACAILELLGVRPEQLRMQVLRVIQTQHDSG